MPLSDNEFSKQTISKGDTLNSQSISSGNTASKDTIDRGHLAWAGDNLRHGSPASWDLLGVGGTPGQSIEAGGISHFQNRSKTTINHG